eukprot:11502641-Heterocapsa_arctica.AAC.1
MEERARAKPHRSMTGNLEEALQKIWKDCAQGRILLCSEKSEAGDLMKGVCSSPWGSVAKLNLDRT